MDQARNTISKIFNGEPRSYTRFNLTQNMEGDSSQVEMKLSSDMDEEVGGNGVGDHLNHQGGGADDAYAVHRPQRTLKNLCFLLCSVLLIFIIGFLIGYLVQQKKEVASGCAAATKAAPVDEDEQVADTSDEAGAAPQLDWSEVKALLAQRLSATGFQQSFSDFASADHQAGSPGDEALARLVLRRFQDAGLSSTWTDEHYVQLQSPPAAGANRVSFRGAELGQTAGYLAYSATGHVQGPVVYGSYGEVSDLSMVKEKDISLSGKVLLLRAGKISFAQKVFNAAQENASAVLIYPDPSNSNGLQENAPLYGHVHLGSGDPYTPGFPSFNHTQFTASSSSGLPRIPAQSLSPAMADSILTKLGGKPAPPGFGVTHRLGGDDDVVRVEVDNVLTEKRIHNVFGVIEGYVDADRYLVIGAQRDSWGPGFARSTVGTSVLVELARAVSSMVKHDDFKPRRSIVFASWSAGEFGNVGATEWLEGYLSSLNMKAFSYINLDGVVTGLGGLKASASPLMYNLLRSTLLEVKCHNNPDKSIYSQFTKDNWERDILEPMRMDDAAYPFLAFSGIPSLSFRFTQNSDYPFFGTMQDTREQLDALTSNQTPQLARSAAQVAGHVALRLVHDHLLRLSMESYYAILRQHVSHISYKVFSSRKSGVLPESLNTKWLMSASGTFGRATRRLSTDIQNSNLEDVEMCRRFNDRIMKVERDLLSPYVSPRDWPFRHILLGSGPHTLQALSSHLDALVSGQPDADAGRLLTQFALSTWTVQGCANTLAGEIWAVDNQI